MAGSLEEITAAQLREVAERVLGDPAGRYIRYLASASNDQADADLTHVLDGALAIPAGFARQDFIRQTLRCACAVLEAPPPEPIPFRRREVS